MGRPWKDDFRTFLLMPGGSESIFSSLQSESWFPLEVDEVKELGDSTGSDHRRAPCQTAMAIPTLS